MLVSDRLDAGYIEIMSVLYVVTLYILLLLIRCRSQVLFMG